MPKRKAAAAPQCLQSPKQPADQTPQHLQSPKQPTDQTPQQSPPHQSPPQQHNSGWTTESLSLIAGDAPHTLLLGTHPSTASLADKPLTPIQNKLRANEYSGPMNFGNPNNSFWNIVLSGLTSRVRHELTYDEILTVLKEGGFALWDVVRSATKAEKGSLDSKIITAMSQYNPVLQYIEEEPSVQRVVMPKNTAEMLVTSTNKEARGLLSDKKDGRPGFAVITDGPVSKATLEVFRKKAFRNLATMTRSELEETRLQGARVVELVVVCSTSPANALLRGYEKEKIWFAAAFEIEEDEAPPFYRCACCGVVGTHILATCPARTSEWRADTMKRNGELRKTWNAWAKSGREGEEPSLDEFVWAI